MPVTPPLTPPKSFSSTIQKTTEQSSLPSPPKEPLAWLWQCHLCHRTYRLGVTRRCLDDGHRFCSGVTVLARKGGSTKIKRHKACASEFDYQGWTAWGEWRRIVQDINELEASAVKACVSPLFGRQGTTDPTASPSSVTNSPHKDCERNCNYPSECRWDRKIASTASVPSSATSPVKSDDEHLKIVKTASTSEFASIVIALERESASQLQAIDREQSPNETASDDPQQENMLQSVVVSADHRRRKSLSNVSSPLSPTVVDDEDAVMGQEVRDENQSAVAKVLDDFEVEMRGSLGRANETLSTAIEGWRSRSPSPGKGDEKREKSRERGRSGERSRRTEFVESI